MEEILMRVAYVYNILGAGVVGAIVLLTPSFAAKQIFAGKAEPGVAMSILGSIWLAVGLASVLGLLFPVQMGAVFLVQLVYKAVWLLGTAFPAVLGGKARSVPPVMTVMFVVWVVVLPFAIPFGHIFGS